MLDVRLCQRVEPMLPSTMPHKISLVVGRTMSFTSETIWPSDLLVVVVVVELSESVREDFTLESTLSPTVVVRFFTSSSTP